MVKIQTLRNELAVIPYPESMTSIGVEKHISGRAFFPGGRGLFNDDDETVSNKPVMVLGQDFGSLKAFDRSHTDGKESEKGPTWRRLIPMLEDLGIKAEQCFFTNAVMGARSTESAVSANPGYLNDPVFVKACDQFLQKQIEWQKPDLILVLGLWAAQRLAAVAPSLKALSGKGVSFRDLDKEQTVFQDVSIDGIGDGFKTTVAVVMHPSYHHLNVHRRTHPSGATGREAEQKIYAGLGSYLKANQ